MNRSRLFSLPLLTKELIEQAQRKRTYILRTIYAIVLYGMAILYYTGTSQENGVAGFENLGRGQEFFRLLVRLQAWAIVVLLPAITCGALTVEKEKDTLALLLLTKLSPRTIVFEKLLSRVFAMATFQLLSLPLFGIVYSIGGVEILEVVLAIVALISLSFAVGSVSVLCSTWFRTTSEAFIMAYVALLCLSCPLSPFLSGAYGSASIVELQNGWTSPARFTEVSEVMIIISGVVIGVICLSIASSVLVPRAFIPAWNVVLAMFQWADRFFHDLNQQTTGGIVLVRDRDPLPLFQPIAWRETRKKSLGTFRYQFRVLMLLMTPLILVIAAVISDNRMDFNSPFHAFPVFFWIVSVVCLTVHSTGVIAAERIRQTLDVVLVSPLTSTDIVLEKLAGVRRLIKVLSVPFVFLIVFQAIWTGYVHQTATPSPAASLWLELVATSMAVVVYMPLVMWIGFQFGLRTRTQIQAVLWTFVSIAAVCFGPLVIARMFFPIGIAASSFPGIDDVYWVSPIHVVFRINALSDPQIELLRNPTIQVNSQRYEALLWLLLAIHFAAFGILWYLLRRNALRSFSGIVHRMEATPGVNAG